MITHSPVVAAMFPALDTLFIETRGGVLNAKPLMDPMPAQPTNHQQHLLFAWRQKLMAALMHESVLIPEGVSDVAWLEALQTALELNQGWAMEHVVSWIAGADEAAMLAALGAALGTPLANTQALTAHLLTQKSYAPTHESAAVVLMANAVCQTRAARLLNALCAVLRDPANANTPLFARIAADSTADMHVFRFVPA